jgi:hypothetical protein
LRAFRLTSVLRIAHVTTLEATIKMVAPSTIQPPHCRCGTKSSISTRKARSVTRRVGTVKMRRARRYRGDDDGAWKCAATPKPKHISVRNAATGCTMRIELRLVRVD